MEEEKHIITLKNENFDFHVFKGTLPVLVKFGTEWSGPCHIIMPILNNLAIRFLNKVKFCQLDIDQFPGIAKRFDIQTVPTLLVIRNGKIIYREQGVISREDLEKKLRELIDIDIE